MWHAMERCDMYTEYESENRSGGDHLTDLRTTRTFKKTHWQLYVKVDWPLNINIYININIYVNVY